MTAAIVVATLVLPFLLGLWVGRAAFAALAFLALGMTLVIRQLRLDGALRRASCSPAWRSPR